jgi:hypothetical protein
MLLREEVGRWRVENRTKGEKEEENKRDWWKQKYE